MFGWSVNGCMCLTLWIATMHQGKCLRLLGDKVAALLQSWKQLRYSVRSTMLLRSVHGGCSWWLNYNIQSKHYWQTTTTDSCTRLTSKSSSKQPESRLLLTSSDSSTRRLDKAYGDPTTRRSLVPNSETNSTLSLGHLAKTVPLYDQAQ